MIRFGEAWNENVEKFKEVPIPNTPCDWCKEEFVVGDQGLGVPDALDENFTFYHPNCLMRTILGSVGHLQKQCSCYGGGTECGGDPSDLTLREAANASVKLFNQLHANDQ